MKKIKRYIKHRAVEAAIRVMSYLDPAQNARKKGAAREDDGTTEDRNDPIEQLLYASDEALLDDVNQRDDFRKDIEEQAASRNLKKFVDLEAHTCGDEFRAADALRIQHHPRRDYYLMLWDKFAITTRNRGWPKKVTIGDTTYPFSTLSVTDDMFPHAYAPTHFDVAHRTSEFRAWKVTNAPTLAKARAALGDAHEG